MRGVLWRQDQRHAMLGGKVIKRILRWFPFQMFMLVLVVVAFSISLTTFVIDPNIEESKREFISDCKTQGGKNIVLNDTRFCVIDGQKFRW